MSKLKLWRVFPWDAQARAGAEFSPGFKPVGQGVGRFDIPELTPVWYFAESPAHAVAEVIQGLRNQSLEDADLVRFGRRLAIVPVTVTVGRGRHARRLPDLCDPAELASRSVRPDALATFDFAQTQAIARDLFDAGCLGFRWWSALGGDWHATILCDTRCKGVLSFGTPEALTVKSESVAEAAARLAIRIA
ncbi:MAG: RES family NAD+ phosphorylase [Gemmatimonadaceae bacterium]|nr:RES family NAD+ phosphorylase [Gemmatimonadaceae bacterium]